MKFKARRVPILIYSVLMALACLFMSIMGPTNAWFSSEHRDAIYFTLNVGSYKLNIYQGSISEGNLITGSRYINLSQEINFGENVDLKLILANDNKEGDVYTTPAVYVRYKLDVYAMRWGTELPIPVSIGEFANGATLVNGWYQTSEKLERGASLNLLSSFNLSEPSGVIGGESLKIVLSVEASVDENEATRWNEA